MVFKPVAVEDIKSDVVSYEFIILQQANRINEALREPLKKSSSDTAYSLFNIQAQIYTLDSIVNFDKQTPMPKFDIALINSGKPEKQLLYLEAMLKWYRTIIKSFNNFDIIPKTKVTLHFGTASWGDEITKDTAAYIE